MREGEFIAKLAEDAYFMRVDNRVTQAPPQELVNTGTMKPQVAVQWIMDATALEENQAVRHVDFLRSSLLEPK
jgi:hypothetical protein